MQRPPGIPGAFSKGDGAGSVGFELARLQNEIKERDREILAARREITTLKSTAATNERLLQQRAGELDRAKERAIKAEGQAGTLSKELALLKADARKLESSLGETQRAAAKYKERVAQLSTKGPAFNEQVATLQAEVKQLKASAAQLVEDNKAATSLLRAKDKELDVGAARLRAAAALETRVQSLENDLAAARKELEQAAADARTLQQVTRVKDTDVASLTKALDASKAALAGAKQEAAAAAAQLKASEARGAELAAELGVMRDELARASAVAGRAAAADARLVKGEGTVPARQHLEEVKALAAQVTALKERLAAVERDPATLAARRRSGSVEAPLPARVSECAGGDAPDTAATAGLSDALAAVSLEAVEESAEGKRGRGRRGGKKATKKGTGGGTDAEAAAAVNRGCAEQGDAQPDDDAAAQGPDDGKPAAVEAVPSGRATRRGGAIKAKPAAVVGDEEEGEEEGEDASEAAAATVPRRATRGRARRDQQAAGVAAC